MRIPSSILALFVVSSIGAIAQQSSEVPSLKDLKKKAGTMVVAGTSSTFDGVSSR